MKFIFNFFVRLFFSFLAAKSEEVLFGIMGGDGLENLLILTTFFVLLSYLVNFLESYYHRTLQSKLAELGWRAARCLIGLNQLKSREPRS